jgi:hypothetical protein
MPSTGRLRDAAVDEQFVTDDHRRQQTGDRHTG